MKLDSILAHIRSMRDRKGISQIINAAEARDSKLSTIDSARERARLWAKFVKLGIKKGDTVFVHTKTGLGHSAKHSNVWASPLTVLAIKPRNKEIRVQIAGKGECALSVYEIDKWKLSLEPTPEALSNSLRQERTIAPKKGDTITIRRPIKFNVRGVI